jgi:uncharacterized protein (TIGR03437 family)
MRRLAVLSLVLVLASTGFGYIRQSTNSATPVPLIRVDNTGIQFYLNNGVVAGAQSSLSGQAVTVISADSNPQAAVHAALATWTAVSTANVNFLPALSTAVGSNPNDLQMTITIGSTAADASIVGGALAVTVISATPQAANVMNGQLFACSSKCQYPAGGILDTDIIISPAEAFSTTGAQGTYDLQGVMTHELGHSLGANHTGILGATMFQYNSPSQRILSTDDLAFVNFVYPSPTSPVAFGAIGGAVTSITGTALLTMVDTTGATTVGGLTNGDGTFSVNIPAGTYRMYAEPLNGIVQPQNLYFTPLVTPATLQATMFGGSITVTANGTSTTNVSAAQGTSIFSPVPDVAVTSLNGTSSVAYYESGPAVVASGQAVDLLLAGPGFDASLSDANFAVLGQGITVRPGGVRLDPAGISVGGHTVLRVTLDVAAQQTSSLASIFVTKGSSTLSLSGTLVVGPPTPTTTSQSIISAAANGGAGASPGAIASVYDIPGNPNLGPLTPVGNAGHYDPYGYLASTLGGVTVTFDGVPAPLFFVYGGQINFQVPFEVAGKTSTQMVVNYLGSASAPVTVPVVASQPAFFTVGSSNAVYVTNADGSVNSAANPAARGTSIAAFGTGAGVLPGANYPLQTGAGAPNPPSFSANGYTCAIGGANAPVAYAGWTGTAVGLAQWNMQIPASIAATGAVPIACGNGSASTQSGLTLFVK